MILADIPMPQDCPMCPMSHWNKLDEFTGCSVVNGKRFAMSDPEYAKSSTRPKWCPLKEIGGDKDDEG